MAKLFISYSNRDERAVGGLASWLREHGHVAIVSAHSKRHEQGKFDELKPEIEAQIADSDLVLLLVTPFWQSAALCQWEYERAEESGTAILAIIEAPTHPGLSDTSIATVDMTRDRDKGFARLRAEISKLLSGGGDLDPGAAPIGDENLSAASKLQGEVIADHGFEDKKLVAGEKVGKQEPAKETLDKLKKDAKRKIMPEELKHALKQPLVKAKDKVVEKFKVRDKQPTASDKKPFGKKGFLQWVRGDKKRMIGLSVLGFAGVTILMSALSDHQFGQKNALQSQLSDVKKRQSLFLSRVASHLLQEGDKETALLLALEAIEEAQGAQDMGKARDTLYSAWFEIDQKRIFRGHDSHVSSAAFSSNGRLIVSSSWDRTVRVWDVASRKDKLTFNQHEGFVNSAAFNKGQSLIVTAALDNKARLFSPVSKKLIRELTGHSQDLASARFSHDGQKIVTASGDQSIRLWEVAGGRLLKSFVGHKAGVESAVFSIDDQHILTASADKTASIVDAETGKKLAILKGHTDVVRNACYDAKGQFIATASEDKTARLWDAKSGLFLRAFKGHKWGVLSAAFSPDGKRLVTGSKDNTARVWNVKTGQVELVLKGHNGIVSDASFSPDGRYILTASGDGTMRMWPLPANDGDLVRRARKTVSRCLTPKQRAKYFLGEETPRWCLKMKKPPYNKKK